MVDNSLILLHYDIYTLIVLRSWLMIHAHLDASRIIYLVDVLKHLLLVNKNYLHNKNPENITRASKVLQVLINVRSIFFTVFLIISLGLKFLFPLNCWYDLICTASLHTWRMKKSKRAYCTHLLIGNVFRCRWLHYLFIYLFFFVWGGVGGGGCWGISSCILPFEILSLARLQPAYL